MWKNVVKWKILVQQEVLGRTNRLFSIDMTSTGKEKIRGGIHKQTDSKAIS
jgi:hypothetical protein